MSCRDSVQDSEVFVPRSMANEMSDVHISWDSTVDAAKAWLSSAFDMQYRDARIPTHPKEPQLEGEGK